MKSFTLKKIFLFFLLILFGINSIAQNHYSEAPIKLNGGLNGDYTIGISGNYLTITDAINDLEFRGVNDTVNFILIDQTYPSETFPIEITEYTGASATCPVTIKPADGITATIEGDADVIFHFFGTSFFTIDGSDANGNGNYLTIYNTNTDNYSSCILFETNNNNIENNTIKNCIIKNDNWQNFTYGIHIHTPNGFSNNLTFKNNIIGNLHHGIHIYGINIVYNNKNVTIENNTIGTDELPIGRRGILAMQAPGLIINNNIITGNVAGNDIAQQVGIYVEGNCNSLNMQISNNIIKSFKYNGSNTGCTGIQFDVSNDNESLIFNNVIYDIQAPAKPVTHNGYGYDLVAGINLRGADNAKIYNNTVSLQGDCLSPTSEGNSTNIHIAVSFDGVADIRNNIFHNTLTTNGTPVATNKTYAIVCYADISTITNIDHNDYYIDGVNPQFAFYNDSDVATLSNWQTLTGDDANSVLVQPFFENDYSLTPNMNCQLDNLGTPLPEVTHDISGTLRDVTTPDIGAYEFDAIIPQALDVPDTSVCYQMPIPSFVANPTGEAYWYADEELTDLLFIGDEFITDETEIGTYNYYVVDVLGTCESPATEVILTINDCTVSDFSWLEDFENSGDLPEIWTPFILDAQGGKSLWTTSETSYSGSYAAFHDYTSAGNNADNWLVSPKLILSNIQGTPILSFFEKMNGASYYDYSGVWISNGSGNPEDGDYLELCEANQTNIYYEKTTISLSDYEGQDVYIAFVYQGEYAHKWYLDDVYIFSAYTVNMGVENGNGTIEATVDGEEITDGEQIEEGKDIIFTATPDNNYEVAEWYVNGSPQSVTNEQFTYSDLQENINVTVEFDLIQNISENNSNFSIYPNPTTGVIIIASEAKQSIKNIEITNLTGKTIQQFNNLTIQQFNNLAINLTTQPSGIYFLKITTNKGLFTEKIIKQ